MLLGLVFLLLLVTLFGTAVLKYFVPQVPLLSHAFIFLWALVRVVLPILVVMVFMAAFHVSAEQLSVGSPWGEILSNGFGLLVTCAIGTLITRHYAKRYSVPSRFPAVGAKTMFVLFVLQYLIIIVLYLIFAKK